MLGIVTGNPKTGMLVIFGLLLSELLLNGILGVVGQYLPFELLQAVLGVADGTPWGWAALLLAGLTMAFFCAGGPNLPHA